MKPHVDRKNKLVTRKKIPRMTRFIVFALISIILLYSLTNVYIAFQTPTTKRQTQTILQYTNTGRFTYLVYLKNNTVYNKTMLRPGEGTYFTQLVDHINATFTYGFQIDTDANINGTYTVQAIIQTKLWTKTYTLVPQTPVTASGQTATATADFPISYSFYDQVLTTINAETGVTAQDPLLIIQSIVTLTAQTNQGTVYSSFAPSINATLGQRTIDISKNLITSTPGFLNNTMTIEHKEVCTQRSTWSTATVLLLLGLAAFAVITTSSVDEKTKTETMMKKITKKYGDWIVEADRQPDATKARIISLKSIEGLAKIGEELGKPIIHYTLNRENEETHMFYVIDEAIFYEYDLKPDGKIKTVATCPQCGTSVTYEDYPGKTINMACPNCGNEIIITIGKSEEKKRWRTLLPRSKKRKNDHKP